MTICAATAVFCKVDVTTLRRFGAEHGKIVRRSWWAPTTASSSAFCPDQVAYLWLRNMKKFAPRPAGGFSKFRRVAASKRYPGLSEQRSDSTTTELMYNPETAARLYDWAMDLNSRDGISAMFCLFHAPLHARTFC